ALKPSLERDGEGHGEVACLAKLWARVRRHGAYRPREDPLQVQSKALEECCTMLLGRLQGFSRTAAREASEWDALLEILALDVTPFESRLEAVWAAIVDLCPTKTLSAASGCEALAVALLRAYAGLADLTSCLEGLAKCLREGAPRRSARLLGSGSFLRGLEEATAEVSAAQVTGAWEALLKELTRQASEDEHAWAATLLQHLLQGIQPSELSLESLRDLLGRSFAVLDSNSGESESDKGLCTASPAGLQLALCCLGRRLAAWDLPELVRPEVSTEGLARRVAEGLEALARPLAECEDPEQLHPEQVRAAMQWLSLQEDEPVNAAKRAQVAAGSSASPPSPSQVAAGLLRLAAVPGEELVRAEARRSICAWLPLFTSVVAAAGKEEGQGGSSGSRSGKKKGLERE
ncbi:unnamed protein product, partial [Polarella glacialis]